MLSDYTAFLDDFFVKLIGTGIDISGFTIDHIAYQTSSEEDYKAKKTKLIREASFISEIMVGEIRVGIFKYLTPLDYKGQEITAVELLFRKSDAPLLSCWEHVELITPFTLEELVLNYPKLEWNTKNIGRKDFPMITLRLGENMQAKFPRRPLLEKNL